MATRIPNTGTVKKRYASEEQMLATRLRHARIAKLKADGVPIAEIAREVGQTVKHVSRVAFHHRPIEVPSWVPVMMHDTYREIGRRHGEEVAASECRRLKMQVRA